MAWNSTALLPLSNRPVLQACGTLLCNKIKVKYSEVIKGAAVITLEVKDKTGSACSFNNVDKVNVNTVNVVNEG